MVLNGARWWTVCSSLSRYHLASRDNKLCTHSHISIPPPRESLLSSNIHILKAASVACCCLEYGIKEWIPSHQSSSLGLSSSCSTSGVELWSILHHTGSCVVTSHVSIIVHSIACYDCHENSINCHNKLKYLTCLPASCLHPPPQLGSAQPGTIRMLGLTDSV